MLIRVPEMGEIEGSLNISNMHEIADAYRTSNQLAMNDIRRIWRETMSVHFISATEFRQFSFIFQSDRYVFQLWLFFGRLTFQVDPKEYLLDQLTNGSHRFQTGLPNDFKYTKSSSARMELPACQRSDCGRERLSVDPQKPWEEKNSAVRLEWWI